jgi:hypothetical protein
MFIWNFNQRWRTGSTITVLDSLITQVSFQTALCCWVCQILHETRLEHIDDISCKEFLGRIRVYFLQNKICPFLSQCICIYVAWGRLHKGTRKTKRSYPDPLISRSAIWMMSFYSIFLGLVISLISSIPLNLKYRLPQIQINLAITSEGRSRTKLYDKRDDPYVCRLSVEKHVDQT